MARLKEHYKKEVVPAMMKKFNLGNVMRVPRLIKIVLNMGLGEAIQNIKLVDSGAEQLTVITGQKSVVTRAKKAISNFKLKKGQPIGCMVTLRDKRMYEFFDRLVNIAVPRVRDFKGFSQKSFDGRGSYTFGLKEQLIFPEINYNKVEKIKGLNISIVTSAKTNEEAKYLLECMGFPFRR